MKKTSILKAARVIRSKNSGPYELTFDIIFKNKRYFHLFRKRNIITRKKVAMLYRANEDDVLKIIYFEPAYAMKITLKRWMPSGHAGESDIYGAQQHAPLLGITF
ncbi:MAG: acyl-CoA synthetase [Candidatus Raymondbacteria bacterium RifOxyA12_full_50_37]|uniref:Acyl-CoA synthetase n=1 Tax=Candidatus Raymondbacteria bacterium RIFOXYD12_FULL_49_13 TaxID=1817890 RepID=A0A1F7F155_UNCRA|nr:MAG: acyl-CoA synthetase [Candidatus Raymondbacteria bacterium RifOxyB12_full_50_8]OGJ90654.1 MAG: acyl-CoA synthetase [Candidatus Raymondbacteria bacterium RifOxyA12_full_50_37]OGJ91997.1 MAG: acyl-CoA synthetase [Candidatus Raymondbacteria bacterium RIFOXYA2_FULL_49_16]OGK00390.1 MAG: acyl-CoA synthetase [Candidatus Raymondbacteria bacterium RIFOXYD12_FULL_49_13]OGK05405.1 MAG: acyl-CoA synthetase [Candidatus Raymondbacteria bacterium RifOxyC12_full_50_8]OGP45240.1 MAG: acyl-CoA synthetas